RRRYAITRQLELCDRRAGGQRVVVAVDIAHAQLAHPEIPALHLLRRPQQRGRGLLRIDDDRNQQMRNVVVYRQFQHLGIDQNEAHIVGGRVEQNRRDHRVERNRLAGSGRSGDQQMRHLGEIGGDRTPRDILAERDGELALRGQEFLSLENLAQKNAFALAVGHFDADHGLAGDRRLDSHRGGSKRHREIVGEIDNLAHLDSGARLEFVHRDDRARLYFDHPALDAEISELLLEHARAALELALVHLRMLGRRQIEQRLRRQFESTLLAWLRSGGPVALLARRRIANLQQPDLQRRRLAVHAVRVDLVARAQRKRDARMAAGKFELVSARANFIGESGQQLGRRPLEHQRKPADKSERDRDQAAGQVERIAEPGGDVRADFTAHLRVVQIPQRAGRRKRKNQNDAAANLAHDRDDSGTRPYALRQPRDQYHRGVRLVSDQTAENRREGRADRTAEVGTACDMDAYRSEEHTS